MTLNAKILNAKGLAGIAVLSLMLGLAVWVTLNHQHQENRKVNIVVVEGL